MCLPIRGLHDFGRRRAALGAQHFDDDSLLGKFSRYGGLPRGTLGLFGGFLGFGRALFSGWQSWSRLPPSAQRTRPCSATATWVVAVVSAVFMVVPLCAIRAPHSSLRERRKASALPRRGQGDARAAR
jgi:hypothetical protein